MIERLLEKADLNPVTAAEKRGQVHCEKVGMVVEEVNWRFVGKNSSHLVEFRLVESSNND